MYICLLCARLGAAAVAYPEREREREREGEREREREGGAAVEMCFFRERERVITGQTKQRNQIQRMDDILWLAKPCVLLHTMSVSLLKPDTHTTVTGTRSGEANHLVVTWFAKPCLAHTPKKKTWRNQQNAVHNSIYVWCDWWTPWRSSSRKNMFIERESNNEEPDTIP